MTRHSWGVIRLARSTIDESTSAPLLERLLAHQGLQLGIQAIPPLNTVSVWKPDGLRRGASGQETQVDRRRSRMSLQYALEIVDEGRRAQVGGDTENQRIGNALRVRDRYLLRDDLRL